MKSTKRYPEVYRKASEYAKWLLHYPNADFDCTDAYNFRVRYAKENGLSYAEREAIWNQELRYALKFWDVSVSQLMACNA